MDEKRYCACGDEILIKGNKCETCLYMENELLAGLTPAPSVLYTLRLAKTLKDRLDKLVQDHNELYKEVPDKTKLTRRAVIEKALDVFLSNLKY